MTVILEVAAPLEVGLVGLAVGIRAERLGYRAIGIRTHDDESCP